MWEDRVIAIESGLQYYLKQIDEAPLLSAEEERELGTIIQYSSKADELFGQGEITLQEKEEVAREAAVPMSSGDCLCWTWLKRAI